MLYLSGESADQMSRESSAGAVTSRHLAGKTQLRYNEARFLRSLNFMIPKKWKNISNKSYRRDSTQGQDAVIWKVIFVKTISD